MPNISKRKIKRKWAATLAELQVPGTLIPSQWALAEDNGGTLVMRSHDENSYTLFTISSPENFASQVTGNSGASKIGVSIIDSDLPADNLQNTLSNFKLYVDSLPEAVQDRIADFFTDSSTVDMVYSDGSNSATLDIIPNGVISALNSTTSNDPFPQYNLSSQETGNSGASKIGVSIIDSDLPADNLQNTLSNFKLYVDSLPEAVQDRIADFFTDSSTVDVIYSDVTNSITLDIIPSGVISALNDATSNDPFPQYITTSVSSIENIYSQYPGYVQPNSVFSIDGFGQIGGTLTVSGGTLSLNYPGTNTILNTIANSTTIIKNDYSSSNIKMNIGSVDKFTLTDTYNLFSQPVGIGCIPNSGDIVSGYPASGSLVIKNLLSDPESAIQILLHGNKTPIKTGIHIQSSVLSDNPYYYLRFNHNEGSGSHAGSRFSVSHKLFSPFRVTTNVGIGTLDTNGGELFSGRSFDGVLSIAHRSGTNNNAIHVITENENGGNGVFVQGSNEIGGTATGYYYFSAVAGLNQNGIFNVSQHSSGDIHVGLGVDSPSEMLHMYDGNFRLQDSNILVDAPSQIRFPDEYSTISGDTTELNIKTQHPNQSINIFSQGGGTGSYVHIAGVYSTLIQNLAYGNNANQEYSTPFVACTNIGDKAAFCGGLFIFKTGITQLDVTNTNYLHHQVVSPSTFMDGSVLVILNNTTITNVYVKFANPDTTLNNTGTIVNPGGAITLVKYGSYWHLNY